VHEAVVFSAILECALVSPHCFVVTHARCVHALSFSPVFLLWPHGEPLSVNRAEGPLSDNSLRGSDFLGEWSLCGWCFSGMPLRRACSSKEVQCRMSIGRVCAYAVWSPLETRGERKSSFSPSLPR
jgi:hypothetical protein